MPYNTPIKNSSGFFVNNLIEEKKELNITTSKFINNKKIKKPVKYKQLKNFLPNDIWGLVFNYLNNDELSELLKTENISKFINRCDHQLFEYISQKSLLMIGVSKILYSHSSNNDYLKRILLIYNDLAVVPLAFHHNMRVSSDKDKYNGLLKIITFYFNKKIPNVNSEFYRIPSLEESKGFVDVKGLSAKNCKNIAESFFSIIKDNLQFEQEHHYKKNSPIIKAVIFILIVWGLLLYMERPGGWRLFMVPFSLSSMYYEDNKPIYLCESNNIKAIKHINLMLKEILTDKQYFYSNRQFFYQKKNLIKNIIQQQSEHEETQFIDESKLIK